MNTSGGSIDTYDPSTLYMSSQTGGSSSSNSAAAAASEAAHAHGNAAIMTAIAGAAAAKKSPTITGKLATLAASVVVGGGAIATKHVVANQTQNFGRGQPDVSNKLFSISSTSDDLHTYVMQIFNLTDDHLLNFLKLVVYFHQVQWFLVTSIGYYALILYIPIEKLEIFYDRILTKKIAVIVTRLARTFKKSGVIIVIMMYALLLASMYLGDYNLDMIMKNYQDLCEHHNNIK